MRIVAFGAHPDDCDIQIGGTAALWRQAGFDVTFVSVTNGDAGHQSMGGAGLAQRRRAEAARAGAVIGAEYLVLDHHDGELQPTLDVRREIIALIRERKPDLVITHRPNDYHPDHRYTSQLVQDAAYMVTVPNVVSTVPHLERNPIFMYFADRFQRPRPFEPDVLIDIGSVLETKLQIMHQHESQFYEWLPYNGGYLDEVPAGEAERIAWLKTRRFGHGSARSERWREKLFAQYGAERAAKIEHVEALEWCEYGSALDDVKRKALFPFLNE